MTVARGWRRGLLTNMIGVVVLESARLSEEVLVQ
jgi:hypothetical protein